MSDLHIVSGSVIEDLDSDVYHADPILAEYGIESLSATWAHKLIPPSTPAHYRWDRDHEERGTDALDFGSAFHAMLLGGKEIIPMREAKTRTSVKGAEEASSIRLTGGIPVLEKEIAQLEAMVAAIKAHPIAKLAFRGGRPEVSMFAQDPETGVWLRGRADYVGDTIEGRALIVDAKTTTDASQTGMAKAAANWLYHLQGDWYSGLAKLCGIAREISFLLVAVEKTPPYLVGVYQFEREELRRAHELNWLAIRTFAQCQAAGEWPGYPPHIQKLQLPGWAANTEETILQESE
jgi:hypothetical protein